MKRKLRPWIKFAIAGIISIFVIAISNMAITSFADDNKDVKEETEFSLHGIITECNGNECYVDIIDGKQFVTQAIVSKDKYYTIGQPITVNISESRNITDSHIMYEKESDKFFDKYGDEFRKAHESLTIGGNE